MQKLIHNSWIAKLIEQVLRPSLVLCCVESIDLVHEKHNELNWAPAGLSG